MSRETQKKQRAFPGVCVLALAMLAGCSVSAKNLGPTEGPTAAGVRIEVVGGFIGGGLILRLADSTTGVVCYGRYSAFSCVKAWEPNQPATPKRSPS